MGEDFQSFWDRIQKDIKDGKAAREEFTKNLMVKLSEDKMSGKKGEER